jgi:TonB family protein
MVHLSMWGPDPAKPGPSSASGGLWVSPDELSAPDAPPSSESDLAELVARFSAPGGGGLAKDLSIDLALEIVLNQIVEQACLATGATGAAIVLERNGKLVCRASTGANAPELGVVLDTEGGLSGACVKTHQMQRCDDAQLDPRADVEASRSLGIRSVMILPLLRNDDLLGVFEIFSSRPSAFGERDERTLDALALRALKNLERASDPLSLGTVNPAPPAIQAEEPRAAEWATRTDEWATAYDPEVTTQDRTHQLDGVTLVLGVVVFACAVLLSTLVGLHLGRQRGNSDLAHRAKSARRFKAQGQNSVLKASADPLPAADSSVMSGQKLSAAQPGVRPGAPPAGSLLIYENGKEVFRLLPSVRGEKSDAKGGAVERASALEPAPKVALSSDLAEGTLLHRVEPEYPEEARRQRIQGPVVLDLRIAKDGAVQDVRLVSGQAVLADAATSAVKQWRFKPQYVDGHEVEMQTRITLRFTLPAPQTTN